ncbi:MAG: UDP-N-acetylmuramoyl-L-alanyl-D-glutamate--2,6-diaminopimelate ligase [Betaproteobacteria bacterium]|nr:UDP-N-acetylmuramoyl-L-alanyl-D-glutamate--2,6-diaminopimelate ligase [Betaproteobacteria bacterium]
MRVSQLETDSRRVQRGDVFLAYPGSASDGRSFIADAIERGAAGVLWEQGGFEWNENWRVPNVPVEGLRLAAGPLASEVYGRPSEKLWIMGVTGTNGKTSTTQWLSQACSRCGARTAVIGTLGSGFPQVVGSARADSLEPAQNTTPDAVHLQRTLAGLRDAGAQGVALEVSSIGLDQGRVDGVKFGVATFTNLSRDHLDYHGDMQHYARAKQRLFEIPDLGHAVLNLDDVQGVQIARMLSGGSVSRTGYSCFESVAARSGLECYVEAHGVETSQRGIAFNVQSSWGAGRIESALLGRFNVSNLLGALATMLVSGVPFEKCMEALSLLQSVSGRLQRIGGGNQPLIVVDYAHTPDALEQALVALKEIARANNGRLAVVFGCGGERDRGKRPLMGAVAQRHADGVVLTSDNPRGEDPLAIIADILEGTRHGAGGAAAPKLEPDRSRAVRDAILAAAPGDVVLIAGKGHETYQEAGGVRIPWSDLSAAEQSLARRIA